MTDHSTEVFKILSLFGWSADRSVDWSAVRQACMQRRFVVFEEYALVVQNLYGISIDLIDSEEYCYGAELIRFDPLVCFTDSLTHARFWTRLKLLPLARVDNLAFLYMGNNNTYWYDTMSLSDKFGLECIGTSLYDALSWLLFRQAAGH
tara:strand:+ start:570 stop:1016 length:447 start_codon:yes stop_codon:yes gene_type:complete